MLIKMDSKYAPIIKKELPNEHANVANVLSDADINNIQVKNEPILDEDDTSLVTIKHETLFDESSFASSVNIKNENQLETQLAASIDRFVIYELESPQNDKQTKNNQQMENPAFQMPSNGNLRFINNNKNLSINSNDKVSSDNHNRLQNPNSQLATATSKSASTALTSTPILLNTKLRKRNKIVLPVSTLDKRTRYNIEGSSQVSRSTPVSTLNPSTPATSSKKIINHLMKHKHELRKQEIRLSEEKLKGELENPTPMDPSQLTSSDLVETTTHKSLTNTAFISESTHLKTTMTKVEDINCETPLPLIRESPQDIIDIKPELTTSSIKSTVSAITGELRVKCLCRLTVDSSTPTDNSEIVDFFKEMFEKTRTLTKKQHRLVKMSLLQSISEAENDVEQGKCCCF